MKNFGAILLTLVLAACVSTKEMAVYVDEPIVGSKEIALVGNRAPWVIEIEKRLRSYKAVLIIG